MDDSVLRRRVSPFGCLRIKAYVPLPEAYRSLSRPSSAPDAKAFPLRSFLLNLRRRGLRFKCSVAPPPKTKTRFDFVYKSLVVHD
jgi:hypothetical protein